MKYIGFDISKNGCGIALTNDKYPFSVQTVLILKNMTTEEKEKEILERVRYLISNFTPDFAVIESVFVNIRNMKTSLELSELHGIIKTVLYDNNISFISYPPQHIKKIVNGNAKKDAKKEMQKKINTFYNNNWTDNETDSIACILCYLIKNNLIDKNWDN